MGGLSCPELEELELLALGSLDVETHARIESHVSSCAACGSALKDISSNLHIAAALAGFQAASAGDTEEPASPEGYRIDAEIGRGGMGTVYRALHLRTGRAVALKVVHVVSSGPDREQLFRREVRALARLRHPGIAAILDAGHLASGRPFLVMDLVEGEPLDVHVARHCADRRRRIELLAELARAIAHAHQRGVIHRDLKPPNVRVDHEGRVRVLDFGLARLLDLSGEDPVSLETASLRIQGTLP